MSKFPPIAALSVALLLLTGCGAASQNTQNAESSAPASDAEATSVAPTESEPPTEAEPQESQSSAPTAASEPPATETVAASSEPVPSTSEPIVETSEPAVPPPTEQQVITPVPTFDEVQRVATTGSTFIITGEGYEPDDQILVNFGPARSDYIIVSVVLYADGTGKYSAPISLNSDLEPGSYAVMTVPQPQRGERLQEEAKRFASIEVVAP